jgi:hypothetical protein
MSLSLLDRERERYATYLLLRLQLVNWLNRLNLMKTKRFKVLSLSLKSVQFDDENVDVIFYSVH